jgi:uncharacterized coiled-coil DUF342 family protein
MTDIIDTNKVIEALRKENNAFRNTIDELLKKVSYLEQQIIKLNQTVFPPPNIITFGPTK